MFDVRRDDLTSADTLALLAHHLQQMHVNSPLGSVFALDVSGLRAPEVMVWTAWSGDRIAGVAALKNLGYGVGELKSMRTAPGFLRKGVAVKLLEHVIETATSLGMERLSLETGSAPAFEAALSLYRRRGFQEGEPFADYQRNEFNQFLNLIYLKPRAELWRPVEDSNL